MNTQIQNSTLPSQAIKYLVQEAIHSVYNLNWEPRVVRQNKKLLVGTLESIDYAVPCFELSRQVKEKPLQTAQKLADAINIESGSFRVEAVSGFVNFELSPEYFMLSVEFASEWFKSPRRVDPGRLLNQFIIVEPHIMSQAPRQEITAVAYRYADHLHDLLDMPMSAQFLLSDYSSETVNYLSSIKRPRVKRVLSDGQIVHNHELLDHEVAYKALSKLRARLHKYHTPNPSQARAKYITVVESEIALKVHAYLDRINAGSSVVIKDEANKAVYMTLGNEALPLRSSSGLLSRAAFIIYMVDNALSVAKPRSNVVVFAPQRLHAFIYAWMEQESYDNEEARLVCFDPYVSRADIVEIKQSLTSPTQHFKQIARILSRIDDVKIVPSQCRSDVLSLVDLPLDLSEFLAMQKFPAIYDALNQSIRVRNKLIGV